LAVPASVRDPAAIGIGLSAFLPLLSTERLVALQRDGRPEPALAERWERSPDGLTWRLYLRPHLQFHDGTPLDAPHVAAALAPSVARGLRGVGLREISSITAEGPVTLVFQLRQATSLFLDALSAGLPIRSSPAATAVSAGPFQLVSRQSDQIHMRAFKGYFRGQPSIDTVDVLVYPNNRSAWSAMMRGDVDFLYEVAPEAVDFIEQSSRTQVKQAMRPFVYTMDMNLRHPILQRREVRVALNQAVNRTKIIDVVFRGRGYPAGSYLWPYHWAYDHLQPRFRFQPDEASRGLDAAGLPWKPGAQGRPGARFSFECLVPSEDLRYERIALMLQHQLLDVGVDMQLRALPPLEMVKRMAAGDYDAVLLDLVSSSGLHYMYNVWHSRAAGPAYVFDSGYAAADEALNGLQAARTDDDTRTAVRAVQRALYEDPPAIFICWAERARAVSNRFLLPAVPDRDIFATLPEWRVAPNPVSASPGSNNDAP
jgi:peptide/nickel transport system substrate-binding protein